MKPADRLQATPFRANGFRAALALLVVAAGAQEPAEPPTPRVVDERPSPVEPPRVPPIDLEGDARPAPEPRALERDGALADRFTAQDQRVRYSFDARASELSLFDLGTWGYSRGWQSAAGVRVLGPDGETLVALERPGGTVYRKFLPFVAPADGTYTYELAAREQYFRYALVRHSSYVTRAPGDVLAFGGRERVHGWLAAPEDEVTYALELEAGREVALAVRNTPEPARNQMRAERSRQPWLVVLLLENGGAPPERERGGSGGMRGAMSERMAGRFPDPGGESSFPRLVLHVEREGERLSARSPSTLFVPPETGTYHVVVGAISRGEGGLFDLELAREVRKTVVHGYVGDRDDEPVADVMLHFLLEPEYDWVGSALTDEAGEYRAEVPPGDYTVFLAKDGRHEPLRTAIETERELNAIWEER